MWSTRYACLILRKLEIFGQILESTQISDFMKIRPVGAELFRATKQRDMTKLVVIFDVFRMPPKRGHSKNIENYY